MANNQSVSLRLDLRIVCILLLVVIAVMLALWRPWQDGSVKRTIEVTGEAQIEAIPDEYVFTPYFQMTGDKTQTTRDDLAKLGQELVNGLKQLGVEENKIKLSGSTYDYYYFTNEKGEPTAQLHVTVTVGTKELAQKVQDYLLEQDIKGQLTPTAQFSQARQGQLKEQARSQAIEDAKAEASRSADELEARLGKVMEIKDSETIAYPWFSTGREVAVDSSAGKSSLPVTPGEETFSFRVTATFELK